MEKVSKLKKRVFALEAIVPVIIGSLPAEQKATAHGLSARVIKTASKEFRKDPEIELEIRRMGDLFGGS